MAKKFPGAVDELKIQKMLVDAVVSAGGFGLKMSHRHLVGVPDLLLKLPGFDAAFVEVKQATEPRQKLSRVLAVTPLQLAYLQKTSAAGMPSGVLSVVQTPDKFGVCFRHIKDLPFHTEGEVVLDSYDHVWFPVKERKSALIEGFLRFCRQCSLSNGG